MAGALPFGQGCGLRPGLRLAPGLKEEIWSSGPAALGQRPLAATAKTLNVDISMFSVFCVGSH